MILTDIDFNPQTEPSTDVLIIGAGPAGSSAARVAAAAGLSVIVIDKRKTIGIPVQCAEYIPAPLGSYALDPGVKIQSVTDMSSAYNFSYQELHDSRGIMISRARFDQALAKRANDAGAIVCTDTYLAGLDQENNAALLHVKNVSRIIRYKMLLAADGPKSRVAKLLGLTSLATIPTRQYTVALNSHSVTTKAWLSSRFPGGYAWLFPLGTVANLGIGFDSDQHASLKYQLNALHRTQQSVGVVGADVISQTGGSIPVSGIRDPLTYLNVIFAGDAAGLTHPISGAGIAAAVMSGEMAGEAARSYIHGNSESAMSHYEQSVRELYEASLLRGVEKRSELMRYRENHPSLSNEVLKKSWIF